MRIFRTCLLCLFTLTCLAWPAISTATGFRSLNFEHIKARQGLQSGPILDIVQDKQGFIWIAGQQGLSRFDGYKFTSYKHKPDDNSSLDDNWIRSLYIDKTGQLWVGSNRGGLHQYDHVSNSFKRYYSSDNADAGNGSIRAIISDGESGLWLASRNGLKHFDTASKTFTVYQHDANDPDSLIDNRLTSLALDAQRNLWVGTTQGLDRKAHGSKKFSHFSIDTSEDGNATQKTVRGLLVDHLQNLWIGSNNGLEVWKLGIGEPERHQFGSEEGLLRGVAYKIYQDMEQGIWIAMADKGLLRWDAASRKFLSFQHQAGVPESLSDNQLESIYQDRTGSLWLGTWSGGINRVDLASGGFTNFANLQTSGGMVINSKVSSITGHADRLLWISTIGQGIKVYDPVSDRELKHIHKTPDGDTRIDDLDIVHTVQKDGSGQAWAATRAGLARVDANRNQLVLRQPKPDEPTTKNSVNQMRADGDSVLWIASINGLLRFDTRQDHIQVYKHQAEDEHSLVNDNVNSILIGNQGMFWAGTLRGLELFDRQSGKFQHFRHDSRNTNSLINDNVQHLFYDSKKQLWVGTEAGLSKLSSWKNHQPQFSNYATSQPVNCLLEDKRGWLWMSLENEIARFNPATGEFKHYSHTDGLAEHGFYINSCYQDQDGSMYFGSPSGIISFKPENIRDNPVAPEVLLTDLQIFNQSVTSGKFPEGFSMQGQIQDASEIILTYKHAIFSIEFSALHYADTQRNKFAYQLQGFDEDWVMTDASKRFASYTNLAPGNYVFRVKAANKDGVWNETGRSLQITIMPPFWQTLWFRLLLAAFLLGVIWSVYQWRVRLLMQQKHALEAEVNHRTMEVSVQKAELELSNQALMRVNKLQEAQQSELTRFLAVASHDLRQPMHALNLYLGALVKFELPEDVRPVVNNLRHCARTMDDMFANLLDLSRLDAQIIQPQIQDFSIADIFHKLDVEFHPQALAKGLEFHIQPCQAMLESDPALVEQILRNLIANAIRYTKAGKVSVTWSEANDRLHIAVNDTGIGISKHDQDTIFEEFFQVETQRGTKGMGLGLAIVQRLVRLLHIAIQLQSTPGQGSTFTITLPLVSSPYINGSQSRTASNATASLLQALIVVIEDDESILYAMRTLLEQWDGRVITATSGTAALELCGDEIKIPDLLICDYRLNLNETGIDVVARLREEFNHHIPGILITGDISPQLAQDARSADLILMHKPVQADILHDTVAQLLSNAKI